MLSKSLQIRIFAARRFSQDFKTFVWVAARLLHKAACLGTLRETTCRRTERIFLFAESAYFGFIHACFFYNRGTKRCRAT